MFLEFFCTDKNGLPLTELYRLDSDTDSEIRATILQSPYHLCLDGLDHTVLAEFATLEAKLKAAYDAKTKTSQSEIKRHSDLKARIERANTWSDATVSVLLETETGDIGKALVWRGNLYSLFLTCEKLTLDTISLNLASERGQAIHSLASAARSVDNPEKSSNSNTLPPIQASETLVKKETEQFQELATKLPATQFIVNTDKKIQVFEREVETVDNGVKLSSLAYKKTAEIELTDPKSALPKLAVEAKKQASNGLKIVSKSSKK